MAFQIYFCYGISVTNESLTYATMAYEQLDGPFRFIRLIQKRIREGSLQTSQPSAVGTLPIEIWDLVRHKVTDIELCAAERISLNQHACRQCLQSCGCLRDCDSHPPNEWAELLRCYACDYRMIDYQGFGDRGLAKVQRGPTWPLHRCTS